MAFRKFQFDRLLNAPKSASLSVKNCRISSSSSSSTLQSPSTRSWDRSQQNNVSSSIIRRWLHKRALHQPDTWTYPVVDRLIEKLKMIDSYGLIRLVGTRQDPVEELSVQDVRKLLKLTQMEAVKIKLGGVKESWIGYEKFVEMCSEDYGKEEGLGIAKNLVESGAVIVLGKLVFLHTQQVVKTIRGLNPVPASMQPNDALKKELQELEIEKAVIDKKAKELVRRETLVRTCFHGRPNCWIHVFNFLGINMGRYGANMLLRHINVFHGWLHILPKDIQRAVIRRVLPKSIKFQGKEAYEVKKVRY